MSLASLASLQDATKKLSYLISEVLLLIKNVGSTNDVKIVDVLEAIIHT